MSNISIIGAGAVGSIAAAYLAKDNTQVSLVDPYVKDHLEAIKSHGLKLKKDGKKPELEELISQVDVTYSINEIKNNPNIVIIATKAFALPDVVNELKNKFDTKDREEMTFVSLQNGYGNEMFISDELKTNVCRIAVNYLGTINKPGEVKGHWLKPPNFIGAAYPNQENNAEYIAKLMNDSGLDTSFVEDIRVHTYLKTVLNSTLCPICTATKKTMAEAMADDNLRTIVKEILIEGLRVAEAIGLKYDPDQTDINKLMAYLEAGGNHPTSMRQDLQRGSQTEIDWINGAIAKAGKEKGVKTPYNDYLVILIKILEKSATFS